MQTTSTAFKPPQIQSIFFHNTIKSYTSTISLASTAIMASKSFHNTHSNTYDRMSSKCTTTVAKSIVSQLTPPISPDSYILDNAAGTGIVTSCIKSLHPEACIKAADLAPGVLEILKSKASEHSWSNVETEVLDVRDLKTLGDETFTHVITNFGIASDPTDVEGPGKAIREMWRVLKPGGVAVVTTWSERNFTTALHATALTIRPHEKPFEWAEPSSWSRGSWLMAQLEDAGFNNQVSVKSMKTAAEAKTLDELVDNMILFKDMCYKGYSEEEVKRLPGVLKGELRKLSALEEKEGRAAVKMVAWVGVAWK